MSDKKQGNSRTKISKKTPTGARKRSSSAPKRGRRVAPRRARTMVQLAPYASNPMRRTRMTSGSRQDGASCRIKGTDFLTSVSIGGTAAAAGDVLVSQIVNPSQLGVARLATMSRLYERYKFRSLKFRYAPVANATVSGQIIGYVDYDTYDDPTGLAGVQNLQRAAAHYGEKPVQIWQGSEKPVFWEIKDVDPMTDLYVDSDGSDPRWTNQGRFVLLAASAIASSTACGNIYLDYDIEFYIPQLELTPSNGYGLKLTGSTTCSSTAFLGTTAAAATWSNLQYSWSPNGNVLTLQPGSYLVSAEITGTTVTACNITSTGTTVYGPGSCVNAGATVGSNWFHVYSTSQFTVTISSAAAGYTSAMVMVALLPRDALTLSARRRLHLEKLVNQLGDLSELKDSLIRGEKDEKPSSTTHNSSASASTSSVSSSSVSAVRSRWFAEF